MFKHISKLSVERQRSCLQMRYQLFLIVFMITKIVAFLSSEDDDDTEDDNDEVFFKQIPHKF